MDQFETEGKDQLGNVVGKPNPGDIVKVHYETHIHGKKGYKIVATRAHTGSVPFRMAGKSSDHQGIYRGLNELILRGNMKLGDSIKAVIPPELAYDTQGLDRCYGVNGGFVQAAIHNTTQMAAPNHPNAPASHQGRNPLSLAYVAVPPNASVDIVLDLVQVNNHKREIPKMTWCECITTSIMTGLGLNAFGERQRF